MEQPPTTAEVMPSFESYGGTAPENYERHFVPVIAQPLAERLIGQANLQAGDRVVDVACGTGVVARLAAERVGPTGAVTGVDVNPGMLAVARMVPTLGTVDWHEASAESLPFDDARQDVVLCQMGLQFFPDKLAALSEARRVLTSRGHLVLNLPGPTPALFSALEAALARHLSPEVSKFVGLVFSLHDPGAVAQLVRDAGFASVEVDADICSLSLPAPETFLWKYVHSTPLAAAVANLNQTQRAALANDFCDNWHQLGGTDSPILELGVTTAIARNQRP
jgi:ubiquinone/menaquinone biosynthesis C-methylase UbiE